MTVQIIDSRTIYGLNKVEEGGLDAERLLTQNFYSIESGLNRFSVKDRNLTSPPGSPADQDAYLVATSPTGDWAGHAGDIAIWSSDSVEWVYVTPNIETTIYVEDEDVYVRHNGSSISNDQPPFKGFRRSSCTYNITASPTQSQGQTPLTTELNVVTSVGTTNDVVTLPTALAGYPCRIWNLGSNTLQIYPASGDRIDEGSVDASVTLAVDAKVVYWAVTDTDWLSE